MDYNNVRELMKKYWTGDTSVDEEKRLKDIFLHTAGVPDDLQGEKDLFAYFIEEAETFQRADFTEKLHQKLNRPSDIKTLKLSRRFLKYAAGLLFILVTLYLFRMPKRKVADPPLASDTFDDPRKAIEETEKTLLLVSENMNVALSNVNVFDLLNELKNSKPVKNHTH